MPAIVDKESVREDILKAFRRCIANKPIDKITLRDVAEEAGMSHAKLLYYFDSRDDLVYSYMKFSRGYLISRYEDWFDSHSRADYDSDMAFFNDFMRFVVDGNPADSQLNGIIQTYVLAQYNDKVRQLLADEYEAWLFALRRSLRKAFGRDCDPRIAEALMIVASGAYICHYNGALSGQLDGCMMTAIDALVSGNLSESDGDLEHHDGGGDHHSKGAEGA